MVSFISIVAVSAESVVNCFGEMVLFLFVFFFFQAEDGIRDGRVTGVQTCALPISCFGVDAPHAASVNASVAAATCLANRFDNGLSDFSFRISSRRQLAERREALEIGRASCRKECRSGWTAEQRKENSI